MFLYEELKCQSYQWRMFDNAEDDHKIFVIVTPADICIKTLKNQCKTKCNCRVMTLFFVDRWHL